MRNFVNKKKIKYQHDNFSKKKRKEIYLKTINDKNKRNIFLFVIIQLEINKKDNIIDQKFIFLPNTLILVQIVKFS